MNNLHVLNKIPKAILVDVVELDVSKDQAIKRLEELESLVKTFGGIVVVKTIQKRGMPDYDMYVGSGKVEEIKQICKEKGVEILVVNNILKPKQVFNLKEALKKEKVKVWDRIDLILKIFSKHAKSTEAKLQIDLAKIRHMGPRIYNMGIELSQQSGAVGLRAGQGESNIEIMKRHLRRQEVNIMEKLKHYDLIRKGHRERRKRQNLKTAAIVGYTNAGKSTLLNALTGKETYIADKLFATLDTKVGKIFIQGTNDFKDGQYVPGKEIIISDTIGFIQDLPPSLIQAFKSTLAETIDADLILHIIDINDPEIDMKIKVVEDILNQLGIGDKPKIYVFNKIDLIKEQALTEEKHEHLYKGIIEAGKNASELLGWALKEKIEEKEGKRIANDPKLLEKQYKNFNPVFVSAVEKKGLNELIKKIGKLI